MPIKSFAGPRWYSIVANLAPLTLLLLVGCASSRATTSAEVAQQREPAWISGQIMGVDRVPIDQYNDSTVHLVVTTDAPEPVHLELGPGWFVDKHGLSFEPDQQIQYRGSPNPNGSITVYELRHGETKMQLRNDKGEPHWEPRTAP